LVLDRHRPRRIAVFGGNNVGKSSVVNILAAASIAGMSPEGRTYTTVRGLLGALPTSIASLAACAATMGGRGRV